MQDSQTRERLETAAIVMQKWFCGGKVDKSVGILQNTMEKFRMQGFAQFNWDSERSLGNMPEAHKPLAPLFCSIYSVSAFYVSLCNKHGMFPMDPSTLCLGLCRWFESICGEYLYCLFGSRQHRDMSRTLEICKCIAAAETTINYSLLYSLRSKSYSEASPKIMLASMMDPIHIHEVPRLFFNYTINNISLPYFLIVSIFQREVEAPILPLESVLELLKNGKMCLCCVKSGKLQDRNQRCSLSSSACHTNKIKRFLNKMIENRAFLPKESGLAVHMDSNITPFITAFGGEDDRCNMTLHSTLGGVRQTSCLRIRSPKASSSVITRELNFERGGSFDRDDNDASNNAQQQGTATTQQQQTQITNECFRLFVREAFVHYKQQLQGHAFIKDSELLYSLHEMHTNTTSRFAMFFGDLPYLGKHKTVMQNIGVHHVPSGMPDSCPLQSSILNVKAFISGELGIGMDWMMMLFLLSISGSARIDQQVAKDVAKSIVAHVFNEMVPQGMYPYNHLQLKEFNPYTPRQEVVELNARHMRADVLLRPENLCLINPGIAIGTLEKYMVASPPVWKEIMMEDMGFACPLLDLCRKLSIRHVYNLPIHLIEWQVPYPIGIMYPVIQYGPVQQHNRLQGCLFVKPGGACKLWIQNNSREHEEREQEEEPYELHRFNHISEVSTKFQMGPRPLFSRSGIAVCMENETIGMLVQPSSSSAAGEEGDDGQEADYANYRQYPQHQHPHQHRLCVVVNHVDFMYSLLYHQTSTKQVTQDWVEKHILAIGTKVWIKTWNNEQMKQLYKHIPFTHTQSTTSRHIVDYSKLEEEQVFVAGVLSPPRKRHVTTEGIWVSIEIRHTHGSLRNVPYADMITLCFPCPDSLVLPRKAALLQQGQPPQQQVMQPPHKKSKGSSSSLSSSSCPSASTVKPKVFEFLWAEACR